MDYRFIDLVDIDAFRTMLKRFYEATGILHGLVDADNNVISAIGWQRACTDFHRVYPLSNQRCEESNRILAQHLGTHAYEGGKCLNGLMDYASPVVIEGKQMATLYFGQVLHEPPDMDFFRRQARECGFDEEAYLEAIREVPVIPRERIEPILAFFSQLAQMLAKSGLDRMRAQSAEQELEDLNRDLAKRVNQRTEEIEAKNLQLAVDNRLQKETEKALRESRGWLQAILDSSPTGIGWSIDGKIEYINNKFIELFGYTLQDIPTIEQWYQLAYPDDKFRKGVIEPWFRQVDAVKGTATDAPLLEAPVVCKGGAVRYVIISVSWIGDRRLATFSDITDRWLADQQNHARNNILELITQDASLKVTLSAIARSVETQDPSMLCSILILDRDGKRLYTGAAPSLPGFYNQAIDGVVIGDGVGSCGTAAYKRQRVVVSDIQSHAYWKAFRELASNAGLASCWSEPLFSSKGKLLGTFAIYHRQKSKPTADELRLIEQSANLASIAVEHYQTLEALEHQAHTDSLTGLTNRGRFMELAETELVRAKRFDSQVSVLLVDIDFFKSVNDRFGHKAGDSALVALATILKQTLREVDIIGRIGGEEFAALLPETDVEKAMSVAERLRQVVADTDISVGNETILNLTISIGVAEKRKDLCKVDNLLRRADDALYEAKHAGRNRVCVC